MNNYKLITHGLSLIIGGIISYLISPLTFLMFLVIWLDAMIISHISGLNSLGFELITLAGLISGLALGPVVGFFFSLLLMPLLLTILKSIDFKTLSLVPPNLNFVAIAIAAALAGFLLSSQIFLVAVIIALFFRHIVSTMIDFVISGGFSIVFSAINIIFTLGFLYAIRTIGLLALFV